MKKSLSHLPDVKQKEIQEILAIIKEEADPEKVILFGSHATGEWVEDEYIEDGIRFSYISDYDFLVVIKKNGQKEHDIISRIENRCADYKNAVTPIVHDIDYINEGLAFGQYFFSEIIRDGILLYDTERCKFAQPTNLSPQEEKKRAQAYFNIWFPLANEFLQGAVYHKFQRHLRVGVFTLHQATECFYNTVLLVFTGYKPKTHNLHKLRNYSKHISPELFEVFRTPMTNEQEYHLFDLLRRGYIDARYKPEYQITSEELQLLVDKVTKMRGIIERICKEKSITENRNG